MFESDFDDLISAAHTASRRADHDASLDLYQRALSLRPDHPTLPCDIADQLLRLHRPRDARTILRAHNIRRPDSTQTLLLLSQIALKLHDGEEALSRLEAALALSPDAIELVCAKAHCLLSMGRHADARVLAADLLARHPTSSAALIESGHIASACADFNGAIEYYSRALARAPGHPTLSLDLANKLAEVGRFKESEALLLACIGNPCAAGQALRQRAHKASQQRDHGSAIRSLMLARDKAPLDPYIRLDLAHACAAVGDFDQALSILDEIGDALEPSVLLNVRGHFATWRGLDAEAKDMWRSGMVAHPENTECYISLAHALAEDGSYDAALATLDQALTASPQHLGCMIARADIQFKAGLLHDALAAVETLRDRSPESPLLLEKAIRFNLAVGARARATALLVQCKSYAANSNATLFLRLRAILAFAHYRFDEAAEAAREILRRNPSDLEMLSMLTNLCFASGDYPNFHRRRKRVQELREHDASAHTRDHAMNIPFMSHLADETYFSLDGGKRVQSALQNRSGTETSSLLAVLESDVNNISAAISILVALQRQGLLNRSCETETLPGAEQHIPKIIHQFWDRPRPPEAIANAMASWPERCVGYTHRLHDDESARAYLKSHFDERILRAFDMSRKAAARSDLFRLALLSREGGVYADADDLCLSDVSAFFTDGVELALPQETGGALLNAFIAARPGHPLIAFVLDRVADRMTSRPNEGIWYTSGPGLWTLAFCHFYKADLAAGRWPGNVRIIDFYDFGQRVSPFAVKAYKRSSQHWLHKDNGRDGEPRRMDHVRMQTARDVHTH